jgi:hypothetical protein
MVNTALVNWIPEQPENVYAPQYKIDIYAFTIYAAPLMPNIHDAALYPCTLSLPPTLRQHKRSRRRPSKSADC